MGYVYNEMEEEWARIQIRIGAGRHIYKTPRITTVNRIGSMDPEIFVLLWECKCALTRSKAYPRMFRI